ncbi:uncharacterized protein LOC128960186 [Oppia nitens]|uniref:uncharacterized protein LOC128960186 n=1 Tax=Oppia nitens TaxID=1686743 RepID=UPI0023DB7217|nr:uncharacterized protein LOC128960186 [Oppia nitens]
MAGVLDLGEVDLWDNPTCESALRPLRYRCERTYKQTVNTTLHMHRMDVSTESVKRAVCCGGWLTKQCVTRAANSISVCGDKVAKLYGQLPSEAHIKHDVLDKCSEYQENSLICNYFVEILNEYSQESRNNSVFCTGMLCAIQRAQQCDMNIVLSMTGDQGCDAYTLQQIIIKKYEIFLNKLYENNCKPFKSRKNNDKLKCNENVKITFAEIQARVFDALLSPLYSMTRVSGLGDWGEPRFYKNYQIVSSIFQEIGEMITVGTQVDNRMTTIKLGEKHNHIAGKVAVVAGADDTLGRETAVELAKLGYKVIVGTNDIDLTERFIANVKKGHNYISMSVHKLDLSSMLSVRLFTDYITKRDPKIDLLVNSGDVFNEKRVITADGFEKTFAVNYLNQFLLTRLLMPNLYKSSDARIVNVTSVAHHFGQINLLDINQELMFISLTAYNQSKLAQVLITRELAQRLHETNIKVYAINPGVLRKRYRTPTMFIVDDMLNRMSTAYLGVQSIIHLAVEDKYKNETGQYYSNSDKLQHMTDKATDGVMAEKLWNLSCDSLNLNKDIDLTSDKTNDDEEGGDDLKELSKEIKTEDSRIMPSIESNVDHNTEQNETNKPSDGNQSTGSPTESDKSTSSLPESDQNTGSSADIGPTKSTEL